MKSVRSGTLASSWRASLALLLLGTTACGSLSDSSKSISDSVSTIISSPSKSLSRSSSPEDAYRDDVRDFTAAYIKSGGDLANLKQEVGTVAKKHGITDWESSEATYEGIGGGMAKAGVTQAALDGYKATIAGGNSEQAEWMQNGYDGEK